jgi:hypothetical protein
MKRRESPEQFERRKKLDIERWRRASQEDDRERDDSQDHRELDPRRDPRLADSPGDDGEDDEDGGRVASSTVTLDGLPYLMKRATAGNERDGADDPQDRRAALRRVIAV